MSNNDSIFQIRGLKTQFFTSKGIVPAVDGVDITVKKGEAVGLVGESGCGKSMTAMSTMQLLQYPGRVVAGEILLDGENLLEKTKKEMDEIRGNRITMIFQEPMTSLNPVYTIGKQVSEAILIHENVSKEEAKQRTIDIFRKVGIPEPEKRYNVFPHQLSGGLRQRVMIGMAMVCNPQLMIADEPTTALDVTIEAQILYLMKQLQKEQGTAVVMITHNLGVVAESCDYVYVMYAGKNHGRGTGSRAVQRSETSIHLRSDELHSENDRSQGALVYHQGSGSKSAASSAGLPFLPSL